MYLRFGRAFGPFLLLGLLGLLGLFADLGGLGGGGGRRALLRARRCYQFFRVRVCLGRLRFAALVRWNRLLGVG